MLKRVVIFARQFLDTHYHITIHLNKASITIQANERYPKLCQGTNCLVISPRFRIVSIIPGMESRAPDRTESKSVYIPQFLAELLFHCGYRFLDLGIQRFRICSLMIIKIVHTSVVMVSGGTGRPIFAISARFPLPPSNSLALHPHRSFFQNHKHILGRWTFRKNASATFPHIITILPSFSVPLQLRLAS